MVGKLVLVIRPAPEGDAMEMVVRHEAPDGLWDSASMSYSPAGPLEDALTPLLEAVSEKVREVLSMTEERLDSGVGDRFCFEEAPTSAEREVWIDGYVAGLDYAADCEGVSFGGREEAEFAYDRRRGQSDGR